MGAEFVRKRDMGLPRVLACGRGVSVARHGRVDLGGPGIDAAGEVIDRLEAVALQECDDLQTSHPVMTNTDDGLRCIELARPLRDVRERDVLVRHAGQADGRQLDLPRLAHVQQQRVRADAMFFQVLDFELAHQNLNRLGSSKPTRRGATVSNSSTLEKSCSALRVNSMARMIGCWPTMAASRPPTFSCASSCAGTSATEPDSRIASNGPSSARPREPSAWRTPTFITPARRRLARAISASCASISIVIACCALWPSSAAM